MAERESTVTERMEEVLGEATDPLDGSILTRYVVVTEWMDIENNKGLAVVMSEGQAVHDVEGLFAGATRQLLEDEEDD